MQHCLRGAFCSEINSSRVSRGLNPQNSSVAEGMPACLPWGVEMDLEALKPEGSNLPRTQKHLGVQGSFCIPRRKMLVKGSPGQTAPCYTSRQRVSLRRCLPERPSHSQHSLQQVTSAELAGSGNCTRPERQETILTGHPPPQPASGMLLMCSQFPLST